MRVNFESSQLEYLSMISETYLLIYRKENAKESRAKQQLADDQRRVGQDIIANH